MRQLALATAGAASLCVLAAAGSTPASACDVTSATDISCGSANPTFALTHQEHPENDSHPAIADHASGRPEARERTFEFNPFGLFSDLGICKLGDVGCPDHRKMARHRHDRPAQ